MDTLRQARLALYEAEAKFEASEAKDGDAFYRSLSERHYQQAAIYAAVAQAEQLQRANELTEESNKQRERIAASLEILARKINVR